MLFLRNMIDNHQILTAILVIYFCLFLGLNQAVAIVWKIVGAALGVIAIIQLILAAIKSLDEKIDAKQKEIVKLDKLREDLDREYKSKRAEMKQRERDVKAARRAYNEAVTAYNSAVTAEKAAGKSYRAAAHYAQTAQRAYMDHVQSCSTCRGSMLCPVGQNLHAAWQSWEEAKRNAKQAWETAKANLRSAKEAKEDAFDALFIARGLYGVAMREANAALAKWRAIGKEIERLVVELKELLDEKADEEERLREAMEQLNNSKQELDIAEQNYPHEWATAMMDPNFRQSVEEIRNYSID